MDAVVARPAGLLRVLVLFHERELLGAATSVLNAVKPLREYGWSVSGWVPGRGPLLNVAEDQLAAVECAERPLAVSLRGWHEDPGPAARLRATPQYLSELRAALLRVRPHVVHANTLLSLPEACLARTQGLPVVIHAHELPPQSLKRTATLQVAAHTADVLVGVSDAVGTMLRSAPGSKPVLIVHNGVSVSDAYSRDGERPFTVGTVGTVCRVKGTDVFLRAAVLAVERRPGLRFEHAGQPDLHHDVGLDDELARLLMSPSLKGTATMLGSIPGGTLLARSDLFVLPSRSDAFPLATLEAMAVGVPVIASRVGGIPEQITHLEHGVLVPSEDADGLADWIVRLHDDADLRTRLATAAKRRVREEFTVEKQAAGLHRAYLLALNRRFGPPRVRAATSHSS